MELKITYAQKRYVIFFDDVWNKQFLNEIEEERKKGKNTGEKMV